MKTLLILIVLFLCLTACEKEDQRPACEVDNICYITVYNPCDTTFDLCLIPVGPKPNTNALIHPKETLRLPAHAGYELKTVVYLRDSNDQLYGPIFMGIFGSTTHCDEFKWSVR